MMSVAIAIGILAVSILLTAILLRLGFVRRNRVLQLVFLVNPGTVGILACATFLSKRYLPTATDYIYFVSMVVIAASMIVLVFVLPRALYTPEAKPPDERGDDLL
jgi:hypothetical protein